jgi:hypothetical protein
MDYLDKQPKLRIMDMRFGTWNVRSLYRAGSLMTAGKEVAPNQQANIHSSMEKGMRIMN